MKTLETTIAAFAFAFAGAGCAATCPSPAPQSSASRFPTRISGADLGGVASDYDQLISRRNDPDIHTKVRFCVKPDGQVSTASVIRASGVPQLDRAIADAIATWTFESFHASLGSKCKRVLVRYRAEG